MASLCLSVINVTIGPPMASISSSSSSKSLRCLISVNPMRQHRKTGRRSQVVCMAPNEERLTRRSPLDFPLEWERPRPPRRPDIFPQFSPMKTPLPIPMPADPPPEEYEYGFEDEEEEQYEEQEYPEEDEDYPEEE